MGWEEGGGRSGAKNEEWAHPSSGMDRGKCHLPHTLNLCGKRAISSIIARAHQPISITFCVNVISVRWNVKYGQRFPCVCHHCRYSFICFLLFFLLLFVHRLHRFRFRFLCGCRRANILSFVRFWVEEIIFSSFFAGPARCRWYAGDFLVDIFVMRLVV